MDDRQCEKCPYHDGLKEKLQEAIDALTKRADQNEVRIADNTAAIAEIKEKAAVTREQTAMIFKILNEIKQELQDLTKAIKDIPREQEEKLEAKLRELKEQQPKGKWYESDIGKYLIKAGIIILVAILAAAIGQNYLDDIKAIVTAK